MEYYNTKEAAKYLNVSVRTIRGWYRKGIITGIKPGGKSIIFKKSDLDKLFNKKSWLKKIMD